MTNSRNAQNLMILSIDYNIVSDSLINAQLITVLCFIYLVETIELQLSFATGRKKLAISYGKMH